MAEALSLISCSANAGDIRTATSVALLDFIFLFVLQSLLSAIATVFVALSKRVSRFSLIIIVHATLIITINHVHEHHGCHGNMI